MRGTAEFAHELERIKEQYLKQFEEELDERDLAWFVSELANTCKKGFFHSNTNHLSRRDTLAFLRFLVERLNGSEPAGKAPAEQPATAPAKGPEKAKRGRSRRT